MTRSRQQTRTISSSPVQTHQLTNTSISLSLTRNRQKLPQWHSRVISTNSKPCFRNTKASPYTHIKNIPQWPTKAKNLKVNSHKVSNTHTLHKAKTKNLLPFSHTHSNGGHIEGKLFGKLTQRKKSFLIKIWVLEEWLGETWIRRGKGAEAWGRSKLEEDHAGEVR